MAGREIRSSNKFFSYARYLPFLSQTLVFDLFIVSEIAGILLNPQDVDFFSVKFLL